MGKKHVPAHLWAELERLPASRVRMLEDHAAGCDRCARIRLRIEERREIFADIAAAEPPELEWDHIGARIHWSRSLERRTGQSAAIESAQLASRWRPWALAVGAATLAAAALGFVLWPEGGSLAEAARVSPIGRAAVPDAVAVELAEAEPMVAMVVLARGDVRIDGAEPSWRHIESGAMIETGQGAVTLQFGQGSGLTLGPGSQLLLRSFDSQSVELVLAGELDVQVSEREVGQQFVIVAGKRSVTVRGTGFRVENHNGDLTVSCEHGRVEVTDGMTNRSVRGQARLRLKAADDLLDGADVDALTEAELAGLSQQLTLPLLPAWTDADAVFASSSALVVNAPADEEVLIDGASLGRGSVAVRLFSGRHQVMVGDTGEWGKGRWVELGGGAESRLEVDSTRPTPEPSLEKRAAAIALGRKRELGAALERTSRLRLCVTRLEKHGVATGTFAQFEVGVNADGSFSFVNIASSNVALETRACLLDAIGSLSLAPGAPTRLKLLWRY